MTGALVGGAVGLAFGVVGWLVSYYLFFMLPNGTSFQYMDQGAIPTVLTGPLGAIIGAVFGGLLFRSPRKPATGEEAAPEPTALPSGDTATSPDNSGIGEGTSSVRSREGKH